MDITVKNLFVKGSPRKIRPLLFGLRGSICEKSLENLAFLSKKGGLPLYKLLKSALAVAKENDLETSRMYIKEIYCNEGPRLKRRRFESKGVSRRITKRMSHLVLSISDVAVLSEPMSEDKAEGKE